MPVTTRSPRRQFNICLFALISMSFWAQWVAVFEENLSHRERQRARHCGGSQGKPIEVKRNEKFQPDTISMFPLSYVKCSWTVCWLSTEEKSHERIEAAGQLTHIYSACSLRCTGEYVQAYWRIYTHYIHVLHTCILTKDLLSLKFNYFKCWFHCILHTENCRAHKSTLLQLQKV